MFRLASRTLPVFAVIIGLAMALAAYMNFSGVRSAYLELIRSRMAMMAESIGNDIAAAQTLGIRLSEQATLPALLARQAAADPLMRSIDVAAEDGTVLFSSSAGRLGAPNNSVLDATAFRHEQHIVNDFGAPVGVVIVRLNRAAIDAEIDALRFDILSQAIPVGLCAALCGSLICLLLLTRLRRKAQQSADSHSDHEPIERARLEVARLQAAPPA